MPFRSKAQAGWMFANHPEMAKRWASETPSVAKLPEHVGKGRKVRKLREYIGQLGGK